ncbi:hypothetical protein EDC04DRAFT_2505323, partial [Pisolithus marmoratus]
ITDTDNAKPKGEFKKLSKNMGNRFDKEKGRYVHHPLRHKPHLHSPHGSIEEPEAPNFKHNASTGLICQRTAKCEHSHEASQNAKPGTIKWMQFTFSVDQLSPTAPNNVVSKPDLNPCPEFKEPYMSAARCGHQATRSSNHNSITGNDCFNNQDWSPLTMVSCKRNLTSVIYELEQPTLKFPSLFSNDFGPSALLSASPTLTTHMNYGKDVTHSSSMSHHALSIFQPTIKLPLDKLLD